MPITPSDWFLLAMATSPTKAQNRATSGFITCLGLSGTFTQIMEHGRGQRVRTGLGGVTGPGTPSMKGALGPLGEPSPSMLHTAVGYGAGGVAPAGGAERPL